MAGNKNSGRRPYLADKNIEEILELSSVILKRWLENPGVDDNKKVQVVSQLFSKRIPAVQEHTGDLFYNVATKVNITHNYAAIVSRTESEVQPQTDNRLGEVTKP